MSTFGGPHDTGVGLHEGLALIEEYDLREWWFRRLFLPPPPAATDGVGLARRLNPEAYYIAMRWADHGISREVARRALFRLTNPVTGKQLFAQAADFGPATRTHRLVDMSPGCAGLLGLSTDDTVLVERIA